MSKIQLGRRERLVVALLAVGLAPLTVLWITRLISPLAAGLGAAAVVVLAFLAGAALEGTEGAQDVPGIGEAASQQLPADALERQLLPEALDQMIQSAGLMTQPAELNRWLVRRLATLVRAQKCALMIRRLDDLDVFQVAAPALGYSQKELDQLQSSVSTISPHIASLQEPLVLNNPSGDERWGCLAGEQSVLLVPFRIGIKCVGAIRLANRRSGFTPQDAQVVSFLADRLGVVLENGRVYEVARRRLEETSLLYKVGIPLAGALDSDEAVSRAIDAIGAATGSELVTLFLVEETSETLYLHSVSPPPPAGNPDMHIPLGEGVIGRVAETGELVNVADVASEVQLHPLIPQLRSELCVPLKLGEWVIGVVDVQSSQPGAFVDKDVRLIEVAAGQLATALQSARLYEATRRRAAELSTLYDATVAISTAELDRAGVIALVMLRLIQAVRVDGGRLALWDPTAEQLVTRFAQRPTLAGSPGAQADEVNSYLLRNVVNTRKSLILYQGDSRLDDEIGRAMRVQGLHSALILPLISHNRVVGLVELTVQTPRPRFSPDEIRLAQTLATQAAIAVENTRLYQETKRAVEELTAIQALSLDITAQFDVPELLERLMRRARQLVNADGSAIYLPGAEDGGMTIAASDLGGWDQDDPTPGAGLSLAQEAVQRLRPLARRLAVADGPISCAAVPLRWGEEQVVGVLVAYRSGRHPPLAAQELFLLELLAPQAAIAIRNAQLYDALERGMQELEDAQAQLVQAEKAAAIGRLVASLAHEINNPLQSLSNCLHLSLHPELELDKQETYLGMAQDEVERLIAIVNRILTFYRPTVSETRSAVDLNQLLHDVLALVEKQLEHGGVETELGLEPALPAIQAVPNSLRQVFLNLIINAVDAMPGGGQVAISTYAVDGDRVGVSVRDTGQGIDEAHLSQIYEPFFTTKESGTGLGLAISYGIVEAHDGTMEVESRVGDGTTFRLTFPIGESTDVQTQDTDS